MTPERWNEVKVLLDRALDRSPEERQEYLRGLDDTDREVVREVEVLLTLEEQAGDFIETPVFDIHDRDDPSLRAGQQVGPYRLVREVGAGGMGTVYLAVRADDEYERTVALKILKRGLDTDEIVRRFRNERQILAGLDHPHIARMLDGGTTPDGLPYFVMDHVEGRPIDVYCRQEGLDLEERLELFLQVCRAVQFAHSNLVVHRDLKPANILVTDDGTPKLLDFGIARLLSPERDFTLPTAGAWRFLTPEYASPEQATGLPITTATDVYSLGVILYTLLADRRPYDLEERSAGGLARVLEAGAPERPSAAAPGSRRRALRGDLDNIALTALHRDTDRRYGSAEALADDVRRHLDGLPVRATPDSLGYRLRKFVGRNRLGVAVAAVILALLVTFGAVVSVLLGREVQARQEAEATVTAFEEVFNEAREMDQRGETVDFSNILDYAQRVVTEELEGMPLAQATLLQAFGSGYLAIDHPGKAEPLLERALVLREENLPADHLLLTQTLSDLARALRDQGEHRKAEPHLRRALAIVTGLPVPVREREAKLKVNLGTLLSALGERSGSEGTELLEEADYLLHDALRIKQRLGVPREEMAVVYHNIGINELRRKDNEQAADWLRKALAIRREEQNLDDRASTASNLGVALEAQGRPEAGTPYFRQALDLRQQLHEESEGTSPLALAHYKLGRNLYLAGALSEAEEHLRTALELEPDRQSRRGIYRTALGAVLWSKGEYREAEESAGQALKSYDDAKVTGWRTADARSVLGAAVAGQGRFREAEPLVVGALRDLRESKRDDDAYTRDALDRVIFLYERWGRAETAESFRQQGAEALPPKIETPDDRL